jgi:hypothetical protein
MLECYLSPDVRSLVGGNEPKVLEHAAHGDKCSADAQIHLAAFCQNPVKTGYGKALWRKDGRNEKNDNTLLADVVVGDVGRRGR